MIISGVVSMVMVGPWGGGMEMPDGERPEISAILQQSFYAALVNGSLILGWLWSGRACSPKETSNRDLRTTGNVEPSEKTT